MIIYKCDFCKSEHTDKAGLTILGSTSGRDLYFSNENATAGTRTLARYHDLHFCALGCFKSFFTEEKPNKP